MGSCVVKLKFKTRRAPIWVPVTPPALAALVGAATGATIGGTANWATVGGSWSWDTTEAALLAWAARPATTAVIDGPSRDTVVTADVESSSALRFLLYLFFLFSASFLRFLLNLSRSILAFFWAQSSCAWGQFGLLSFLSHQPPGWTCLHPQQLPAAPAP